MLRIFATALCLALGACSSSSGSSGSNNPVTLGAPDAPAGSPAASLNSTTKLASPLPAGGDAQAATPMVWYRQCNASGCSNNSSGTACSGAQTLGGSCGSVGATCVLNTCGDQLICGVNNNLVNCQDATTIK